MKSPSLRELPPPPAGKTGWPWTVETPPVPPNRADGSPWPGISIVSPSYNQADTLEETIRSVLLQGYPEIEYVVIDGGSSDDSVAIIKKYEKWLKYWVSERDAGQVEALHKGFRHTGGEYQNWLCSDDYFLPHAFETVACVAMIAPEADLISGVRLQKMNGIIRGVDNAWQDGWFVYLRGRGEFPQETTFFSDLVWKKIGSFDEQLNYNFDMAFHATALKLSRQVALTSAPMGVFSMAPDTKTGRADATKARERARLREVYWPRTRVFSVLERMSRSRLYRLSQLLTLLIYAAKVGKFVRVEYNVYDAGWRRAFLV